MFERINSWPNRLVFFSKYGIGVVFYEGLAVGFKGSRVRWKIMTSYFSKINLMAILLLPSSLGRNLKLPIAVSDLLLLESEHVLLELRELPACVEERFKVVQLAILSLLNSLLLGLSHLVLLLQRNGLGCRLPSLSQCLSG